MANIQPKGVDKVTGQDRPIEITDVRTDSAGQWLDIPTPGKWGSNTETLSGALTLTDLSPALQFIDGDTADRDVNLPAAASTNPVFTLTNTGLTVLTVLSGTTLVGILFPGKTATLQSDGTTWIAIGDGQGKIKDGQIYAWGGNSTAGRFLHIFMRMDSTGGDQANPDLPGSFHHVVEAGTIDGVTWLQASAGDFVYKLYINEVAESEDIQVGGVVAAENGYYRFKTPISVSVGDRLAIEDDTPGGEGLISLRVRNIPTVGYAMGFAGNPNSTPSYYQTGGIATTSSAFTTGNKPDTTYRAVGAGNIVRLAWTSAAAGGADGTPSQATQIVATGGRTLTFTASGGTLTASSGSFITDGYKDGMELVVTGTTSNNKTFYINAAPTALGMVIAGPGGVTDEGPLSSAATLNAQSVAVVTIQGSLNRVPIGGATQTGGTGNAFEILVTTSLAFTSTQHIEQRADDSDYGASTVVLYTDVIGHLYRFGGNPTANEGLTAWTTNHANSDTIADDRTMVRIQRKGRVTVHFYASGTMTAPWQLVKNGIMVEELAVTGSTTEILTNTYVKDGDILQIKVDGSGAEISALVVVQ